MKEGKDQMPVDDSQGTGHLHVQWGSLRGSAVPLCECMCVCVSVHICTCTHMCACVHMHVCMCVHAYLFMHTRVYVHVCMSECVCGHACLHVCTCLRVCACLHLCVWMCMFACVHACVCVHVYGLGGGRRLTQEGHNSPSLPPVPNPCLSYRVSLVFCVNCTFFQIALNMQVS